MSDPYLSACRAMVETQLIPRGIRSGQVLEAMTRVPRHQFVDPDMWPQAYDDRPLPIGRGQTISQPYIVALMAEALEPDGRGTALEIGTGCGYAAAVLSLLFTRVITIERWPELAKRARMSLTRIGAANAEVRCGDGTLGAPGDAPFEAISVTACAASVPPALKAQLAVGGRLVLPVGEDGDNQQLLRIIRDSDKAYTSEQLGAVRFVPLVGTPVTRSDK